MSKQVPPTEQHGTTDSWQACRPGQLQQVGSELRATRRREKLAGAAQVGAWSLLLLAVGVFLGTMIVPAGESGHPGGISCLACVDQFSAFHAAVTGSEIAEPLTAREVAAVRDHLDGCQMCRGKFEQQFPGVLANLAMFTLLLLPLATLRR